MWRRGEISVKVCQEYRVLAAILTDESHASLLQSFCRPTRSSFDLSSLKCNNYNELNTNDLFSLQYILRESNAWCVCVLGDLEGVGMLISVLEAHCFSLPPLLLPAFLSVPPFALLNSYRWLAEWETAYRKWQGSGWFMLSALLD